MIDKSDKKVLIEDKKLKKLIIKISLVTFVFLIMVSVLGYNIRRLISERSNFQSKVISLTKQNNDILKQIRDLDDKSKTAKKYIEIWENDYIPEQKKLNGVDIEEINNKIQELAKNNDLSNVDINFSPVIIMGDRFERNNIAAYTTLVGIKFSAIADVSVFSFIDQLQKSIGYFTTIQDITLKRTGRVDDIYLTSLSDGESVSAVDGEINIRIYGLGEK